MRLLYVLVFEYIVIIYIFINDTCHKRSKIYGINGSEKIYLKQNVCIIGTEEYNNEIMRMNTASMIYDKNKEFKFKSFSEKCFRLC